MKAVLIQHGVGRPTRQDIETDGKRVGEGGMYMHTSAGKYLVAAYIYAPEHADKAFELLNRQYDEEHELKSRHAKEWNQLSEWRLK